MAAGATSASASANLSPRNRVAYHGICATPAAISGPHLRPDRARAVRCLAKALGLRADEDGDFSEVLVLVHELVCLGHLFEAERPPEYGTDLPGLDQLVRAVAFPGVREVRADDPLLAHPQVADVEIQRVAGGRAADHDGPERLHDEHGLRERRAADVLEDDVRLAAELLGHGRAEAARFLEARLLLVVVLVAGAHHARELVAVNVVACAERLDELTLLGVGDHPEAVGTGEPAQLGG